MKKIKLTIIVFFILSFTNFVKADLNISLKKYLDGKDIEKGSTQIYLLKRCSSVYAYASGVILKSDAITSKNFIEISNNLLFKSVELMVIDENKSGTVNAGDTLIILTGLSTAGGLDASDFI